MPEKKILPPGDSLVDAFAVRKAVFVEEQGFSQKTEFDATDTVATHIVFYEDGAPVATGRVFAEGDSPAQYHLGRIAILKPWRKTGLGRLLMAALEDTAQKNGAASVILGAQCQARPFYEKCGYTAFGDVYDEEGCPHIYMQKELSFI